MSIQGALKLRLLAAMAVIAMSAQGSSVLANTKPLTVVELFQSQGCSDCPPTNAVVMALSDRPDLLTLSFGVTYWDNLGWKDTFASPQYTARQWDYAHGLRHTEVYTPQVIVNGRADIVGTDRGQLEALIQREANQSGPDIRIDNGSVTVGTGAPRNAQVWLMRYDPNIEMVAVTRGENGGRTLPHRNVVKQLVELGDWAGKAASYRIPQATQSGLREAVLVQAGPGGEILAAARD